ncbi:MAG TPA: methyltransferase domain-containing protein, partial [Polyangia bacterium]|nr:methyltransferase domain-containing protein [Polyangia bacterium]
DRHGAHNQFVGVEVSAPMAEAFEERFGGMIRAGVVRLDRTDLRYGFPPLGSGRVSLALSVLTLQFIPIEYRQRILGDIYAALRPGGALIIVEKVLGSGAKLDELYVEHYLAMKAEHGYTQEQIERKRYSLEGVLVPVSAKMDEMFLDQAGFAHVDCFWRWLNFAGWLAVKSG